MYINPVFTESVQAPAPSACVPVDQFPVQDFNLNPAGHPCSDVSLLMRAETQELYNLYASRLQELKLQQVDTTGMSDEQILSSLVPRHCQLPSELAQLAVLRSSSVNPSSVESKLDPNVKVEPNVEPSVSSTSSE